MMYNKEQWNTFCNMFDAMEDLAFEYVNKFSNSGESITGIMIEGESIVVQTEENWNFGGHSTNEHSIPIRYMYTENWKTEESEERERIRITANQAEHVKLVEKQNKVIADEQAKYLELKAKYGDD